MDVFGRFRGQLDTADRLDKGRELERSGLSHLRDGDLRMAKTDLRKAVGYSPNNTALRVQLSGVLARLGEFEDAEKELLTAIKLNPQDETLRFAHGQVLEEMHRGDEAIAAYALAARLDMQSARGLTAISSLELKRGNLEEAEQYVVQALDRDEKEPQIWGNLMQIRLALLVEEQGDLDRGMTMLLSARDSAPADRGIQAALDGKMTRRGKLKLAIDLYRQMIAAPPADLEFYREMELTQLKAEHGDALPRPGSEAWIDLMQAWLGSAQAQPTRPIAAPPAVEQIRVPMASDSRAGALPDANPDLAPAPPRPDLGTIWPESEMLAASEQVAQSPHTSYPARPAAARQDEPAQAARPALRPAFASDEPSPSGRLIRPATIGAEEPAPPNRAAALTPEPQAKTPMRPAAPVRESGDAIAQVEFEIARDPGNSKLRRDLSILYLQAGRLAEAKEQARKAEELRSKRMTPR